MIQIYDLDAKRPEILKEAFPHIRRVAVMTDPTAEQSAYRERIDKLHSSARHMKMELQVLEASQREDVAAALAAIERGGFDALMVRPEPRVMDTSRHDIVATAARLKLPAIYAFRLYAEAGGLMSYGESLPAFHHRSASFVNRILKGAKAGELAFERPTKFELIVNLKTAQALRLEIPKAVLFRADEVIK